MIRLLVIGNCQARPVSQSLGQTGLFDCLEPIILHLARNDMRPEHEHRITSADLILAQATVDTFPVAHLRSARLRARLGDRVIVWPNMFYSGQQPFARYITLASGERLLGPTEAVHDLRFFWDWWQERHDSDIRPRLPVGELAREISDRSLRDLRQRETNCDIPISDVIAAHSHDRRLFFTFNHPTRFLIRALCDRILSHIGLPVQPENRPQNDEPLGRYVVPSTGFPMTAEQDRYVGNPVVFNASNLIATTSERKTYTWSELRAAFFQCYDHMVPRIDPGSIRLTPNMPGDLCRDGANG